MSGRGGLGISEKAKMPLRKGLRCGYFFMAGYRNSPEIKVFQAKYKGRQFLSILPCQLGEDGEIRVHFFAGEGAAPRIAGLVRKNRGIRQCAHWTMKLPPAVSIMIRISPSAKQKSHPFGWLFVWRRWRDSNSRRAFDPYTISNRARSTNYATSPCCSRK